MMKKMEKALSQEAETTPEKTQKGLKRKRSSLYEEGVPRKASTTSAGDVPKERKLSKPKTSKSATGGTKGEARKTSLDERKLLQKSKTFILEKPRSKSIPEGTKLIPSKSLLELKRETAATLASRKLSTGIHNQQETPKSERVKKTATRKLSAGSQNQQETPKLERVMKTATRKSSAGSQNQQETPKLERVMKTASRKSSAGSQKIKETKKELKPKKPEKGEKPENLLKVVRSDDLKKLTNETIVSPEIHEERMEVLRQIVHQAELDRRIFCVFDRRRHVTAPIREELIKRGWEEYQPEKGSVLRKNRSSPSKIVSATTSTMLKNTVSQDTVTQGVDRTAKAMFGQGKTLHVASPVETDVPVKEIKDIFEYGMKWIYDSLKRKKMPGSTLRTPAEMAYMNKYIEENNIQVTLVILSSKPEVQLSYFSYIPDTVNKFQKTSFCTKYGLWYNLKTQYPNLRHLKYPVQTPRMYNLGDRQNYQDFAFDFYTTTTTSILRWLVVKLTNDGVSSVTSTTGKIPTSVFKFAIKKAQLFVNYLSTENAVTRDEILRTDRNWRNMLLWFYKMVNEQEKMEIVSTPALYTLHSQAVEVLRTLRQIKPESANDGMTNLWIVKPYSASCGRGIFITNNFYYLEQLEQKRYIIQKYIERPFLISGTKFDIRQWFLVTSLSPLQIWMYKECYLRFCSVPFNLQNLHESLHLTNNAIQRKYAKFVGLPCQNMWDSHTFQRYLRETGYPTIWEERIYPGMRDALIATLLCSQHTFDTSESKFPPGNGWFEVFGADFMLTEDLREGPWLIEINENPALDHSTPITGRLCPKMLRDVVKVVVDWRNDPQAGTGEWELAFSGKAEK